MSAVVAMLRDEQGATIVEYAIILALLSIVSLGALATIATNASGRLSQDQSNMTSAQTSP
jgi:Flp pilus assembly pilin Flp